MRSIAKKNNLLDMRTDGEITKEEFAVQKQKIDAVLADLENEYASMLQSEQEIRVPELRWDEIKETLTQILDFSQPQVNPDLIRKFVSKIVPDGKNHFRWYMNLDRHNTTSLDVVTEGRKSNAVVTFDSGGDKPPLHTGDVITISQLKEKKSSTLSILHRPRSRRCNYRKGNYRISIIKKVHIAAKRYAPFSLSKKYRQRASYLV